MKFGTKKTAKTKSKTLEIDLDGFALKHPQGYGQHFALQSYPAERWHFFAIATLTHLQPHKYAVVIKVFGLAFFKKQVGLGNAQGFLTA
ncbi:MAG: hypothetical protein AB7E42_10870 [Anaerotignaceae bacterium]